MKKHNDEDDIIDCVPDKSGKYVPAKVIRVKPKNYVPRKRGYPKQPEIQLPDILDQINIALDVVDHGLGVLAKFQNVINKRAR